MSTDLSPETITSILNRPLSERLREYKYRFAQSTVFGLPVIALHYLGPSLGGAEAARWAGLFQLLLAGWVMYVGVVGMLVEAMMRKRATADGVAAAVLVVIYLIAAGDWVRSVAGHRPVASFPIFHWSVAGAILWAGWRMVQKSRVGSANQ